MPIQEDGVVFAFLFDPGFPPPSSEDYKEDELDDEEEWEDDEWDDDEEEWDDDEEGWDDEDEEDEEEELNGRDDASVGCKHCV